MTRFGIPAVTVFFAGVLLLPFFYPTLLQCVHAEMTVARFYVFFIVKVILLVIGLITVVRWLGKSSLGRELLYSSIILTALFAAVIIVYHHTEKKLERSGMKPGILFTGYAYFDSLTVDQFVICDEEGINRFGRPMPWLKERQLNAQGFISPFDFDSYTADSLRKSGKILIALFGDSFMEGVSEDMHVDSAFIELLRRRHPGWALASFGVGGTGPADYARWAEKYLPVLNPHLAVVVFYTGNDIMKYDIPVTPGVPNFWSTNCGWLESTVQKEFTGGNYLLLDTPQKAYLYYRDRFTLFGKNDLLSRYFRQSRILTSLYCTIFNEPKTFPVVVDSNITCHYLRKIYAAAEDAGSKFIIVVIPDDEKLEMALPENHAKYQWVFKDLFEYVHIPTNLTSEDYIKFNRHFNDAGNRKFSFFLESVITHELQQQQVSMLNEVSPNNSRSFSVSLNSCGDELFRMKHSNSRFGIPMN